MSRCQDVKISGLGSFEVRAKSARLGLNPKTGAPIPIAPRRVVMLQREMRSNQVCLGWWPLIRYNFVIVTIIKFRQSKITLHIWS